MEIIKHGKTHDVANDADRNALDIPLFDVFECGNCGCIFSADIRDYTIKIKDYGKQRTIQCKCPDCGELVYKSEDFQKTISIDDIMAFMNNNRFLHVELGEKQSNQGVTED